MLAKPRTRLGLTALVLTAFVAGLAWPTWASQEAASPAELLDQKIIQSVRDDTQIMVNLGHLSDVIGPRLTGSANLKRANEWAAERMREYGLENVRLEPWEIPIGWERGTAYARIVEPDNSRTLILAAMGWTPGTEGRITGDVVVVRARTPEELQQYKGKLKNAIVLRGPPATIRPITDMERTPPAVRPTEPRPTEPTTPVATRPTSPTTPTSTTPRPTRPGRPEGFDTRGALAFRREMAEFFRSEGVAVLLQDAGKPHSMLTMSGGWGRTDDRASAPTPLPAAFMAHEHYALLYRLATRPEPAVTRVEIEINNQFVPGPLTVYNTVGEIRGSEKPDEFVVLGAHIDSWDLASGTTDNGTGTSVVLEAARVLANCGVKPKRTIRFVLFSGEEQGLHGSRAYVRHHEDEMPRTSAAIIHDTGTGRVLSLSLMGREKVRPLLEQEFVSLKALGLRELSIRSSGGSDHQSFEAAGVPGFMFQQDPAEYRLTHHSQTDTLDKARPEELIQGAQVMAVMAMRIANLEELLPRERR
ncbi:MAG TPA: M20/M25/M40 family metallo-hydrolase [Gemmatales bacterium]|mgnify:CR=1 FL=1|nr:M20/M25/M40 family metallo-hydrolase [Gemmatales bacterium]HMP58508.1 M20/M25/M40 family metallo-hydrolase [Gemmatales bacterium]